MTPRKFMEGVERITTEYLMDREIKHILAALMPQNRLIFEVILHNGARISDVLNLRTDQLKPSFWYTEQKTGKRRRMGLEEPLLRAIKRQSGKVWAFPGRDPAKHKTRQAVWADVKRAQKAFRLPQNIGTHTARKIYAVNLMDKYGDIEKVRRNLNHASSSVTAIYAMADMLMQKNLRKKRRA